MAFRCSFRRKSFRRAPRARNDLLPITLCEEVVTVPPNTGQNCDASWAEGSENGFSYVGLPNLTGSMVHGVAVLDSPLQERLSRGLKLRGMEFDLNIANSMLTDQQATGRGIIVARAAIVVLTVDPNTGAPLFTAATQPVGNLFTNTEQDKDDILWRAQFHVPWSTITQDFTSFVEDCGPCPFINLNELQYLVHRRVRIRTRRNLKEDQSVFFCWNTSSTVNAPLAFVFDLFGFAAVQNWGR